MWYLDFRFLRLGLSRLKGKVIEDKIVNSWRFQGYAANIFFVDIEI